MPGLLQPQRTVEWSTHSARVTVVSMFSRTTHTMDLPILRSQWDAWQGGQHIQSAMPHLSPDQREFLLTGATSEEWDAEFGPCEACGAEEPSECRMYPSDPSVKCKWPSPAERV